MIPTKPIKPTYIFSIMEIETWFIAEYTHFTKVDPALTCSFIENITGFDPSTDDPQMINHPAGDLDSIYRLVGKSYDKNPAHRSDPNNKLQTACTILDYDFLYLEVVNNIAPLRTLIEAIEQMFI